MFFIYFTMALKNLLNVKKNIKYLIHDVLIFDKNLLMELSNFGISKGSYVSLIGSNFGKKSYLIMVDGGYFALDKNICEKILIDE